MTFPDIGAARPAISRRSVVLPPPFGPASAITSPWRPARSTSSSTGTPSKPAAAPETVQASPPGARILGAGIAAAGRHAAGSASVTQPRSTTSSASAPGISLLRRCSDTITARPPAVARRAAASSSSAPSGSSCDVGSSRTTSRGRIASADASASRWRSPPLKVRTARPARCSMPTSWRASPTRWAISRCGMAAFSSPNATSRSTVA